MGRNNRSGEAPAASEREGAESQLGGHQEKVVRLTIQFFLSCCHHTFPQCVTLANYFLLLCLGFSPVTYKPESDAEDFPASEPGEKLLRQGLTTLSFTLNPEL